MNIRHTPNGASTTSNPTLIDNFDFATGIGVNVGTGLWQLTNMVYNVTTQQINYNHVGTGVCYMEFQHSNRPILTTGQYVFKMQYATNSPRWKVRVEVWNIGLGVNVVDRTFDLLVDDNGVEQVFYFDINPIPAPFNNQVLYKFTFNTTNVADDITVDNIKMLKINDAVIDLSKNTLLTTHNDNNIIYDSIGLTGIDNFAKVTSEINIKYAKYGDVTYNQLVFSELFPNTNGVFIFNLKQVAKAMIAAFYDNHIYKSITGGPSYISEMIAMKDLFVDVRVSISIKLVDNVGTQTYSNIIDIPFCFCHGVAQLLRPNGTNFKEYSYQVDFGPFVLHPAGNKIGDRQPIRIFKGFPSRIFKHILVGDSLYMESAFGPSTEINYNNVGASGINTHYVAALTVSDGINTYPTVTDWTIGQTTSSQESALGFTFEIIDKCGLYFKWLNSKGGMTYWCFQKHFKEEYKTKDLGEVVSNRFNLAATEIDSYYTDLILKFQDGFTQDIGKNSDSYLTISDVISNEDLTIVREILDSPCVYMYMLPKGTDINDVTTWQQDFSVAWQRVGVEAFSGEMYNTKKQNHIFKFKILVPNKINQTL